MIHDVVADFPRAAGRAAQTRGGGAPTKPAWWISNRETEEKQLARLSGCRLYVHAVRAEGYYSLRSGGEAALQVEQQRVRRGVCQSRGEQMRASRRYLRVCERSPIDSVCSRCRARPFSQTQRGRAVCSCGRRLHPITPVSSCRVPLVEGCAPTALRESRDARSLVAKKACGAVLTCESFILCRANAAIVRSSTSARSMYSLM